MGYTLLPEPLQPGVPTLVIDINDLLYIETGVCGSSHMSQRTTSLPSPILTFVLVRLVNRSPMDKSEHSSARALMSSWRSLPATTK